MDTAPDTPSAAPSPAAFEAATENSVLRRRIAGEIRRSGPLPFRRFMELALYDPGEGYYAVRQAVGTTGDYLTSPELHPLFGGLLARQVVQFWELLARPSTFTLVEVGAGSAALARAILASVAEHPIDVALRYVVVEPRPRLVAAQQAALGALVNRVSWVESLSDTVIGPAHCILSNELIDSLPVHRVRIERGRLRELFVALDGDRLTDLAGDPSTPALAAHFDRLGLLPGEDCEAEVNLDALAWLRDAAERIDRGFLLTLDYGYPARTLYAPWRRQGTLLCFYGHTHASDPYQRVGRQDITTHVDFSSLALAGRGAGLEPLGFTSQQRFLTALGIGEALAGGPAAASSLEEYLARRRAVEALLDPQGLGRIRVLVQGKGVGEPSLLGFPLAAQEPLF